MQSLESRYYYIAKLDYDFNRPLGKHLLGEYLSKAAHVLQNSWSTSIIQTKISSHSACKISISNLLNNNVNHVHISQLSGHKNVESLKSCHSASTDQKQMSDLKFFIVVNQCNITIIVRNKK